MKEGINANIYFKNTGAGYKSQQQVKPCHVLARKMGGNGWKDVVCTSPMVLVSPSDSS